VVTYYWLKTASAGPVKLELIDAAGAVKACAASDMERHAVDTEAINVQPVWEQPAAPLAADAGMHRFALKPPAGRFFGYGPAAALTGSCKGAIQEPHSNSPPDFSRRRDQLEPGNYTLRLTVDGHNYEQAVAIKPDPRLR
jgi:hypothetical protein